MNALWREIQIPDTSANNLRYDLEGFICRDLESGETETEIAKTNEKHNALNVEFSKIGKKVMETYLNNVSKWYNFTTKLVSDSSFIITDISIKNYRKS